MFPEKSDHSNQSFFESLEERVLFDGVPDATFILPQSDAAEPTPAQIQNVQQADIDGLKELILIDAGVQDSEQLLDEVLRNRPDSNFEIRVINGEENGVAQISELLGKADRKYDAIHIISHGDEGQVNLGNTTLSAENLNQYTSALAGWAESLTGEADLLFYGCDLAGNAEGEQFIESISAITGADVAASDDLTGAANKGGDWDLELKVGTIETQALVAESWDHVLLDKDGDGVDDENDLDDDNDGILDTEEGFSVTSESLDLSGYTAGSLVETFSVSPNVDVRISITSTNGSFVTLGGATAPFFDPAATGFAGAVDDLAIIFDPPNGNPSPVVIEVEFFEAGTTNPLIVNGLTTEISDIDSSNPTDPATGRRDRVTIDAFQGGTSGTAQPVSLSLVDPANATLSITGNQATGLNLDTASSINDDNGSVELTLGAVDSFVITYDELQNSTNPVPRGIGVLGNFSVDVPVGRDTDGDGIDDHCDLDSDNDGISDLQESGNALAVAADTNNDGHVSIAEAAIANFTDNDGDGVWDQLGTAPVDTDNDGIDDYLDLDSDNDGIPDAVENQPTAGYQTPAIGSDADGDGILDTFDDPAVMHGGDFGSPEDTDNDGTPDYLDTDSDNDGINDETESGLSPGADNDGDGIADNIAPGSYGDTDGIVSDPSSDLDNEVGDNSEVGYRETIVDLVTAKTLISSDNTPAEGDTVTFQISVTNNSVAPGTNISLTDLLPAGLTPTAGNGVVSQGSYNAATGLWNIGDLASSATATLTLEGTVNVGQGGNTITNVTTAATGDQPDLTTAGDDLEAEVAISDEANLVTTKTLASGDSTPNEGDTVTFQIQVTNDGAAQATNVSLTDLLPPGLTVTGNNGTVSQGTYNATTGVWTIGTLADGGVATLTLEGTVDAGQGGNTITNTTTAAMGDQTDPTTAGDDLEEDVVVNDDADLVTVKTLTSGDSTPNEGDTVTFQIQVTNNGAAQATNVSLNDLLPPGLTTTSTNGTISQGTYNSSTGLWDIGTLSSGGVATLTLEGTVDIGQGGNTITNTTTAAMGDQPDPSTAGDDLEEAVVVDDDANLVTVKTLASGDSTPNEGDTVTFQIQVTNNGAAQATNVSLTDLLPPGLTATGTNGTISQGTYNSSTGLWNIGTLSSGGVATLTLEGTVDAGQGGNTITNTTTAAMGDQPDPSTAGDDLEEAVVVDDEANLVTVKTLDSGDSTPNEGDTVTFQIQVTNNGAAQATNLSLTDLLPPGLTATGTNGTVTQGTYNSSTGLWNIGTLSSGGVATLTLEGTVDAGQGGNTITNTTTAALGDQPDPSTAGDDLEEAVVVDDDANLVTVKTLASLDSTPNEGDTVTFQIQVTNNGAAQATNVSLTDLLPPGLTATSTNGTISQGTYNNSNGLWDIGTLASGGVATLTLDGTVDDGQGGNTITNTTTAAMGDQPDPSTAGDDLEEEVVVDDEANLVTVKTLASLDSTPNEGDTVTFQIQVTNNGAAQATNVSLTDLLPPGLTATGANGTTSQGTYNSSNGVWDIGTLASGGVATLTLEGTVDAGQGTNTITNTTTAAMGDQPDPSTAGDDLEEAVVVDNNADLVTVKTLASGDSTPNEGETVTFQIQVTNNGAAQATNVSLTDLLPPGLTATGTNGTISQGTYNSSTGLWDIGTLSSGGVATLTLEGTVDNGQSGNTITNMTTAAMGDQPDPSTAGDDLDEAVVVGNDADLVTVKTLASGDSTPNEGSTVTFQIQVTNNGVAQATNVSLTDLLPPGLTATGNNGAASQGTYNATTGLWDIGTLANGGVATLTLEGIVDAGQGGNTITNTTTAADGDQTDPSTAGDDLEEAVVVDNNADLVTVKTLASLDSTPNEGDTVTFQIQVTNNGDAQATNVSLTDLIPPGLTATGTNGTTSQGTYNSSTGLWDIGTLASGGVATLTLEGTVDAGQGGNTITNTTTAAIGDQPDPSTAGDDLEEAVVVDNDANLVTVKTLTSLDSTPNEGDTVTFQIQITNNGAAQATNVSLTDLLPPGLTATGINGTISQGTYNSSTGLWDIGTLASGGVATLTLEGTVDAGQGGNTINNTTTAAAGDQPDPSTAGDDLEEEVVVDNNADLVTVKTLASGDSTPNEGGTVTFQIQVTNNGAAQATNVSLTDLLPSGLTATGTNGTISQGTYNSSSGLWDIGTLASGGVATLTLEGTVDAGQGGNTINNITSAAAGDQPDPSTAGDDLEEAVVVDNYADLVTVKTLASLDSTPNEGDTVTFQIQITNNGAAQATNVSLTDLLPPGLTATGTNGTVSQGTYNNSTGMWDIGTLASGGVATLTLEGTVDIGQGGNTITNTTTAAMGDQSDPSTAGDDLEEAVVVDNNADLVTIKTLASGDSTPNEGDTVTFQIQITNNGAAQATNVSLTDLLPPGLTATGTNGTISQGTYNSSNGLWDIGTLASGGVATLTLEGTVDAGQGSNTITNTTTAAMGDQPDPSTAGDDLEEAVVVDNDANLVTVKTLASANNMPAEGEIVTYQIQVTNNGASQATNVSLIDLLPTELTATGNNGTVSQGTYNATSGLWDIGTLSNGQTVTLTLEGTLNVGQGGNTITNVTTAAEGDQPDPTTAGDDLTEIVGSVNFADLATVKTLASGNASPLEGDTVTFQIQVTNNGAAQATNVSLTDVLPPGLTATGNNGTVSQGTYNSSTGVWDIGTLLDNGIATLTLEGTIDAGQGGNTITNTTTAAMGNQPDPSTAGDDLEEAVVVDNNADLVTVKTLASLDSTPNEGETVTFQILVTNNGVAQATNVSLTDLLPPGLTATGTNGTVSQGMYNSSNGLWDIGTLASGGVATITLEGTVDAGQGGNTINNTTTAAMGDQTDPSTAGDDLEEAVAVDDNADLVTVKTLASLDSTPNEGETVTFQIQVTNNGAAQATNVSLIDLLPPGLTATGTNGTTSQGTYNSSTGLWDIGTLASGGVATITLEGTVDAGQGGSTINNTTTAAMGDQPDPNTAGDDLEEAVVVDNNADLVTVKTLASLDSTPNEGDTVTFQIQVTNNGAAQATNVSLTDLLPPGLTATGANGTISQGTYNSSTGLWNIGTLASGGVATLTLEGTVDVGQGGNTITNTTTAGDGDQPDPSTAGDDLDEEVIVDNNADLVTVKTLASGDSTPNEGGTVTFQIQVTNNGAAQATNVSLTDLLPPGLTATGTNGTISQGTYNSSNGMWDIGTLASGGIATLTLEGTVDVGQGGNTINNVTTAAEGDQPDPSTAGDDLEEAVVVDNNANLVTVKTLASGNTTPAEGEIVTFQIQVTNHGAALATNVSLTDLLPTELTATGNNGTASQGTYNDTSGLWDIGTLSNGQTVTLTLEGTLNAGQGGNTITNVTTAAEGDQPDPTNAGDDLTEVVGSINFADLATVKTLSSGDSTPNEGETVTFQIQVTNNGAAQATNVSLTDLLPPGLTATGANGTVSQGTYNSSNGFWDIGSLGNGAVATLTLEGIVDAGQGGNTITNMTTAAMGDQPDPSTAGDDLEEAVVVDNYADLVTVKTLASLDSTPNEGDTVTFQIQITNNGAAQATNVSLTDLLPPGLTATGTNGTISQGTYNSSNGLWDIGTLASGGVATLTLEGTVDAGQGGNTITNTTTAAEGDQPDPSTAGDDLEEAVVVDNYADLVTVKTLASLDSTPNEGDTVTFQIQVTNNGAAQATNVSLTDLLPPGLTATGTNGTISQGTYNSSTGLWDIGTLANGGVATLTLEGTVDAGQGTNTINNITTAAEGDQPDPSTAGDDLEEAVVVDNNADLVTVKTLASGDSTPNEGDTVTFQIQVTNNGAAQATNVSLTDLLPPGLTATGANGTISQGTYNSSTGLWDIGTLASGGVATLTLEGTVNVGQGGNTITNTTTAAEGDQPDPSTAGDDLEEAVVVDNNADLVTVKTLASLDTTPAEGDVVTFQIQVTNNGAAQATNITLTDFLPSGLTATANNGVVTQGLYNPLTGVWDIGTLTSGATVTLLLEGTLDVGQAGNTISNITTPASGDQPDPTTAGDDLSESVGSENLADLVTTKTLASGDSSPNEGEIVTFQIYVVNNGSAQATNVYLTDLLPSGVTAISGNGAATQGTYNNSTGFWDIGTLANGGSATLTLTGTVDIGQGGSTINNTTTAAMADQPDPTTAGDDLEEEIIVENDADLVTVKTLSSGNSSPLEGEIVTFQIQVTNNGITQATNVSLTDLLPAGLTATGNNGSISHGMYNSTTGLWEIGTLANGEVATLTLEGAVNVGEGGSIITNTTTAAEGDQPDPTTDGDDLNETITVENLADLVTTKTLLGGDATHDEGGTVTFEIRVTNNGSAQATNVSLTDLLPAGLTATASNGQISQGTYNLATGVWNIGTLANGADAILTLEGTVDAGQGGNTITNITTAATGDQPDPTTDGDDLTESINVNPEADLVTTKILSSVDSTPNEGDTVAFTLTVTNQGAAAATNVSLSDLLPPGLTATGNNGTASQGSYNSVTGLWNIGALANGESATLFLEGTVDAGQGGNSITNVTTAATGDQPDPSTAGDDLEEEVVVENQADLITIKTLASGDSTPEIGDTVTFQIEVTNNGVAQATNVTLIDLLPPGLTATSANGIATQGSYNATNGEWNIGTLNLGETVSLTLEGIVEADQAGLTIANVTSAASGDQPDPSTVGDDLNEDVIVEHVADLGIAKSILGDPVLTDLGNYVVTYQVVVENTGSVDLANVSLLEDIASQFGSAYVDAGNLALQTGTSLAGSNVTLNLADWDGSSVTELLLPAANNILAIGDSFTISFDAEIDPRQVTAPLENQVEGSGLGVDASGNPATNSGGAQLTATDSSDAGTETGTSNPEDPGDQGTPDDPTPFAPPAVPLSQISGTVFQDDNGDGVQQAGESGISGVEVTLTGTDVLGNLVNITVYTDSNGQYVFDELNAGTYAVVQTQPAGFEDGEERGDPAFTIGEDSISNIQLGWGESATESTFAELLPGAAGNPPQLPGLPPISASPINNLLSNFLGNPGPIYSGIPINANGNPLTFDSGRAVNGGYSVDSTTDCGCPEPINPCCEPVLDSDTVEQTIVEQTSINASEFVNMNSNCLSEESVLEGIRQELLSAEEARVQECQPVIDMPEAGIRKPGFLKRFASWMVR